MKTFSLLAAVLALGLTLTVGDADAAGKRLGGGKSSGMQRDSVSADKSAAGAPGAAKAPTAAAAAQPKRSWMGPLAGLAAGLGLAALASHLGFGEELASMLMIGLLVMAAVLIIGFIMRRRAAARQAGAGAPGGLQYAAAGPGNGPTNRGHNDSPMLPSSTTDAPFSGSAAAPVPATASAFPGAASEASVASSGHIPQDFDAAGFVRNAKVSFIRLQAANDAGNLDDIREFTTPEMFAEIKMAIAERGDAAQETDVVTIEAEVLDVAEEASRYVVSVRFSGLIREDTDAAAEAIDEVWHLVKPRQGKGGWLLAGIQQTQ
ncbi:TIM44-like domain-containing protein [Accumulibacter sp.]|jgi:predicted lipid-binding transport protein (Tim44 family)|uniref:Tim44 domain-containing protein n=1 Tax=Accumulibacter sp. TaxID=2053492 RepID=UPI002C207FD6|nr:TIM44-like domain-containing protein [Accumulibacter sp.]HRF06082.1 TIM44-like domain-containing protein [Accumulibacter sp.]